MRRWLYTGCLVISLICLTASNSVAVHDTSDPTGDTEQSIRFGWKKAMSQPDGKKCAFCHQNQPDEVAGPHGGYMVTTNKCMACHTVHKAANAVLLPGTTVTSTCNFCHDLTQSDVAPYFSSYLATDEVMLSAHQVEGLDIEVPTEIGSWAGSLLIPGGDPISGDGKNLDASAQGKLSTKFKFTCDSCHTPHAIYDPVNSSVVEPYLGESRLKFEIAKNPSLSQGGPVNTAIQGKAGKFWLSDRLLKTKLNGVSSFVYKQYNSDWCAACHMGRFKNGLIHNHPVAMNSQAENQTDKDRAMGYQFLDYLNWGTDVIGYAGKSAFIAAAKNTDGTFNTFYWATQEAYDAMGGKIDYWDGLNHVVGPLSLKKDPRTNKVYAMTPGDPVNQNKLRTIDGDGHVPITDYPKGPACQQCHGNARDVEQKFSDILALDPFTNENALITTFPHVSRNKSLLIENNDDFCTNCHGLEDLP